MAKDRNEDLAGDGGGSAPRLLAATVIAEVLKSRIGLDDVFEARAREARLEPRDEALARAIAVVSFRRLGTIRAALNERLDRGLPRDELAVALLVAGAAQVLFLDVPDHAAVDSTVETARRERRLRPYANLANALLRRIIADRDAIAAADPLDVDTPAWLRERWSAHYGEERARAIAAAHRDAAAVDLTCKADPQAWAERLEGALLPQGSVRLVARTPIRELPGFEEGAWWVQDAAASLPARLLAARPGERVADLCAAPGGKTAQLAAAGASVLAVDRSAKRLRRVRENLARLGLEAELRAADALALEEEPFDAILLDAPCAATGTIRRHPDVAWTKIPGDLTALAALQARLLDKAASLLKPGGRLVYCTCSLEPEEGEHQAAALLERRPELRASPIGAEEIGGLSDLVDPEGRLRSLPFHPLGPEGGRRGMDGFFAARFVRS